VMDEDILRSAWRGMAPTPKTNAAIKNMMRESAHPVLKRIRKQLIIETLAFTLLLFVYYDFFDGHRKPLIANVLLVTALLFAIIHNILGYVLTRRPVMGNTIKASLTAHYTTLRKFAVVSVGCRVLLAGCLLLFFTQVIKFTPEKYWMLATILVVFMVQLVLLWRMWMKRLAQLKGVADDFE
jgi:hypothetical protein